MPEELEPPWSGKSSSSDWRQQIREKSTALERASQYLRQIKSSTQTPGSRIWFNQDLYRHEATANLDNQPPATLFYLGLVKDIPQVEKVFVEELERGRRKHWAVISERDYDAMEEIYDIEETTLDRFPTADIDFRVTVLTEGGPSVSRKATLIYDTT